MPVRRLHEFVVDAATRHNYWHLGLDAGLRPRERHSDFSTAVAIAPALRESLEFVCANSKSEDASAAFTLAVGDDRAMMLCGCIIGAPEAVRQIELFRLGALIEIVRTVAGEDWKPARVSLQSPDDGRLNGHPLIRVVSVDYSTPQLAIDIPRTLLGMRPSPQWETPTVPSPDLDRISARHRAGSFESMVLEIVSTQLRTGHFGLRDTADALGLSTRSLQRRLAAVGVSFSSLLDRARSEAAKELLADRALALDEISTTLGYTHSTHFARAFRRTSGMSPRQYRQNV